MFVKENIIKSTLLFTQLIFGFPHSASFILSAVVSNDIYDPYPCLYANTINVICDCTHVSCRQTETDETIKITFEIVLYSFRYIRMGSNANHTKYMSHFSIPKKIRLRDVHTHPFISYFVEMCAFIYLYIIIFPSLRVTCTLEKFSAFNCNKYSFACVKMRCKTPDPICMQNKRFWLWEKSH